MHTDKASSSFGGLSPQAKLTSFDGKKSLEKLLLCGKYVELGVVVLNISFDYHFISIHMYCILSL